MNYFQITKITNNKKIPNHIWLIRPSRPWDKEGGGGGSSLQKNIFRRLGPQSGLKIRAQAPPLDQPLKTTNHHREGIYTSFELISPVLAEVVYVVQFWGSRFETPGASFFLHVSFFSLFFFLPGGAYSQLHNVVNWKRNLQELKQLVPYVS